MYEIQARYYDGSRDVRYASTECQALATVEELSPGAWCVEATGPNNRRLAYHVWYNAEHTPPARVVHNQQEADVNVALELRKERLEY